MKRILLSVMVLSLSFSSSAQWQGDPTLGTPVVTTSNTTTKLNNVSASDGANGMFVAWIDNRNATVPAIYIQRILQDGTLRFNAEVLVSDATGATSSAKQNLYMVADGAGGVILVWQDSRNRTASISNDDIYGQRVDANGNVLWTANGVRMTVADNTVSNKITPVLDIVNATEAIIIFGDNRSTNVDLYAQKITLATGSPVWATDMAIHGTVAGTQNQHQVVRDGSGGAYIAWQDARVSGAQADVYAQHIDNTGAIVTGWGANGNVVSAQPQIQFQPQLVSLGTSGFVITWTDQRVASGNGDIYIQQFNAVGVAQWTPNGVALCTATGNQSNPQITASGSNFIVTWSDARVAASDRNIYAQAVDANGVVLWPTADGVAISTVLGSHQPNTVSGTSVGLTILPDNLGGAIIIWDDARNASIDIYAQRINALGTVQWAANGVPVSTAGGSQLFPVAVNSIGSSVIVAWRDSRTASNGEIYAARLQSTGVLPVRSININAITKSSSVDIRWNTVDEENTDKFIVEKSNDGVNFTSIGSVKAKGFGNGSYVLEDVRPVKGFNYYRVKAVDVNRAFRYSSVVSAQFNNAPKASMVIYPNPVQGQATLQLANLDAGTYQLKVRDLTGRTIVQRTVAIANNYAVLDLLLQQIATGSYFVQLETAQRIVLSSVIQKQ